MRSFGRRCRGQGKVFVTLVRQTEKQLLELGEALTTWTQEAKALLEQAPHLSVVQRGRLQRDLEAASDAHRHIVKQSQRLTQGKKLTQYKIVNAYDPTIAPIIKGKSNCPAQFGRKTGIVSEPATGFIFATRVPEGNPSDPSYVLPLLDHVQHALDLAAVPKRLRVHSLGGDLGVNDATLRATLEWSHNLLDANERVVLRRLSVFVGSFRLDAAQETVAFAGLDDEAVLDRVFDFPQARVAYERMASGQHFGKIAIRF